MATERDRKIRARAYELWVEGGQRPGSSDADWLQAEAEYGAGGEAPEVDAAPDPSVNAPRGKAAAGETESKSAKAPRTPAKPKPTEAAGSPPSADAKPAVKTGGAKVEGATKVATKRTAKTAGE